MPASRQLPSRRCRRDPIGRRDGRRSLSRAHGCGARLRPRRVGAAGYPREPTVFLGGIL